MSTSLSEKNFVFVYSASVMVWIWNANSANKLVLYQLKNKINIKTFSR